MLRENALGRTSKDRQDGGTECLWEIQTLAGALRAARDLPCLHFLPVLEGFAIGSSRLVKSKKKVGAGIGATPTWGYCVCCYLNRRKTRNKVSKFFELNINKRIPLNTTKRFYEGELFLLSFALSS